MLGRGPPHFCGPRQVVAKRIRRNADAIFNHRAMASEREFEWAMVANVSGETEATKSFAHPQDWRPLLGLRFENFARVWAEGRQQLLHGENKEDPTKLEQGDFHIYAPGRGILHCRIERALADQGWTCLVREADPTQPDEPTSYFKQQKRMIVREIPAPLLVACSLLPTANQKVDAIFTTLAGAVMLRVPGVEDPQPDELTTTVAYAAASQGRLQSRNQKVVVMPETGGTPLGIATVPDFFWQLLAQKP